MERDSAIAMVRTGASSYAESREVAAASAAFGDGAAPCCFTRMRLSFEPIATSTPAPRSTSVSAAAIVMSYDWRLTVATFGRRSAAYTNWMPDERPISLSAAARLTARTLIPIRRFNTGSPAGFTTTGSRDRSGEMRTKRGSCADGVVGAAVT